MSDINFDQLNGWGKLTKEDKNKFYDLRWRGAKSPKVDFLTYHKAMEEELILPSILEFNKLNLDVNILIFKNVYNKYKTQFINKYGE